MKSAELKHLLAAIIILAVVAAIQPLISANYSLAIQSILFAIIILFVTILSKKITAYSLDCDVEHELWHSKHYGFRPHFHLKKPIPLGIILPIFISIITLGAAKLFTVLVYEAKPLKHRAARRFGFYSFAELTDRHNAYIGASSIIALLVLSIISYLIPGLEYLTKLSIYYALSNMLPVSKLDGSQIFFGSRILYAVLAAITIIFAAGALLII